RPLPRRGGWQSRRRRRAVSQLGDLDVLVAHLHGPADMDLEGDDALVVELLVRAVDDPRAIQVDRYVLAPGGDHEFVPIALLDELPRLRLGIALEDAAAPLLVEQSPVALGDVGLRAGDDAVGLPLAAELDARVAVLVLHLRLQHEVAIELRGG